MSTVFEAYATDENAERDGKWVELRAGLRVKVRYDDCLIAREWATKRAKKNRQLLIANGGVLPPKIQDQNHVDLLAEVLVVDWSGITDREGNPLPCTKDNVRMLMRELPSLRRDVLFIASTEETFRAEAAEVDAMGKTAATPSEPSSSSEA